MKIGLFNVKVAEGKVQTWIIGESKKRTYIMIVEKGKLIGYSKKELIGWWLD